MLYPLLIIVLTRLGSLGLNSRAKLHFPDLLAAQKKNVSFYSTYQQQLELKSKYPSQVTISGCSVVVKVLSQRHSQQIIISHFLSHCYHHLIIERKVAEKMAPGFDLSEFHLIKLRSSKSLVLNQN